MRRFRLSLEAASDVREIWAYIAADNVPAARWVRLRIFEALRLLAANPHIGHTRRDLTRKPVLFWPTARYLIVYDPVPRPIDIVRVIDGARDLTALL